VHENISLENKSSLYIIRPLPLSPQTRLDSFDSYYDNSVFEGVLVCFLVDVLAFVSSMHVMSGEYWFNMKLYVYLSVFSRTM
jgi:uncharacterized protein (DUF1501 family)